MTRTPDDHDVLTGTGLPDIDTLRKFFHASDIAHDKRDLARIFGLKGQERTLLRQHLRALIDNGDIVQTPAKTYIAAGGLPETLVVEIAGIDRAGECRATPVDWTLPTAPPDIVILNAARARKGDRVLVRTRKTPAGYEGRILKSASSAGEAARPIVGVFRNYRGGGTVTPTDKKDKDEYFIPADKIKDAHDGDLVIVQRLRPSQGRPRSANPAEIIEVIGDKTDPKFISLIAIHSHSIPAIFPPDVIAESEKLAAAGLENKRTDLRHLPLVTIDGADARDFDDAVFAAPDDNPENDGGHRLVVAIADVSHYVRPDSTLDREAFVRGNSTYFADRVVPMLPERLSNDLCSLRPHENRACLAVMMTINRAGDILSYNFVRALMRSAARLTYEQVEDALHDKIDDTTGPLRDTVIKPLYDAYRTLKRAREKRGALEIDLPERRAIIENGVVKDIVPRNRLQSHQLIEEFMVLANVCAARQLENKKAPCLYRVHDAPSFERLEATREFLKEFGFSLPKANDLHPRSINQILKKSMGREDTELIHTMLLRAQSQAIYSPENNGHFGLALHEYAHFTSPIRRYADLIVHRSLVRACGLGDGGIDDEQAHTLDDIAEHLSVTERRSMIAERDVMDRFTAQYLQANIGATFKGRISGVQSFGLFVSLTESGADGILPIRQLPQDYYIHDEKKHMLIGKNTRRTFRLADAVVVRLLEADPMRGSTVFAFVDGTADTRKTPAGRKTFRSKNTGGQATNRHRRPSGKNGEKNGGKNRGKKPGGKKRR